MQERKVILASKSPLIDNISGDFYSIVGLPISKVYCALKDVGVDVLRR